MGLLKEIPMCLGFTMARWEASQYQNKHHFRYGDLNYAEELYVDEDDDQITVLLNTALWPIRYFIRVKYDKYRTYKSKRWIIELMEFVDKKDREPGEHAYRVFYSLPQRYETPLAAHRAAMDHMWLKEKKQTWYVPPQTGR
jgi:sulfur relay (sulfurtransferase) DsrC/TusE family protein